MDVNKKQILLCTALGIVTFLTSVLNVENPETEKEASAYVSETESLDWGIKNGRYNKTPYDIEISETTAAKITEEYTDDTLSEIYSESETEIFSESTSGTTSLTTSVSDISDTTSIETGVSKISETTTSAITTIPEETTAAASPANNQSVSNPLPYNTEKDYSYFDSCVFVGDSIMEGLSAYGFFPESQVFASVGLNPYQLNTNTIDTYYGNVTALSAVVSANPSNIYIMMGMNGVAWDMNDSMTEQIGIFIDNVKAKLPAANIYIMSVTPVSAEREAKPSASDGKILNSQINSFNASLLSLANDKSVYYLDINSYLKGSNGCLPSDLTSDGIHISKAVYEDIISYILSHTV